MSRPRVMVSRCLLGDPVRYDGGHREVAGLREALASVWDWVPVCPEVEAGMPVPRPPIDLVGVGGRWSVVESATGRDVTPKLRAAARARSAQAAEKGLDGAILKARSPSCGIGDARRFVAGVGGASTAGFGALAGALRSASPLLPMVDESVAGDGARLVAFIGRVHVHHLCRRGGPRAALLRLRHLLPIDPQRASRLRLLAALGDAGAFCREASALVSATQPALWPREWISGSLAITLRTVRDLHASGAVKKATVTR